MMDWNNGTGWHNGVGWGGWLGMGIFMILFWTLVIWGIVVLVRYVNAPSPKESSHPRTQEATTTSDEILAKRFARGEISEEEYIRHLAILGLPQGRGGTTHNSALGKGSAHG